MALLPSREIHEKMWGRGLCGPAGRSQQSVPRHLCVGKGLELELDKFP